MSDRPQGPGWWQASDGKFYPPHLAPQLPPPPPSPQGGPPQGDPDLIGNTKMGVSISVVTIVVFVGIVGAIVYHVSNAAPSKPSVSQVCQDFVTWHNDLSPLSGNQSGLQAATSALENDSAAYGQPFAGYASTLENAANNDSSLSFLTTAASVGASYKSSCDADGYQIQNLG